MGRRVEMPMDAVASREMARHHGGSTGRTYGTIDCEVLKISSLFCHLVDARRLAEGAAVDAQIAVSPIIGEDENDIGFPRFRFLGRGNA